MATLFLLVNCVLSFVTSQMPINLPAWNSILATNNPTCEAIGGYDYVNDLIKIYGGANSYGGGNTNKIVFDPSTRNYTMQNDTGLPTDILNTSSDSAQIIGPNADNIIYFISRNSANISGLNMIDDTVANYAYLDESAMQYSPGLCIDDATATLYSVGLNVIQICSLSNAAPQTCTATQHNALSMLKEPACEYYNGSLFVFGGQDGEADTDIVRTIWKCDPLGAQNCSVLTAELTVERAGIRSIKIDCFAGNYVALIGGRLSGADPTSRVALFDLQNEIIGDRAPMDIGRKAFVGVFAPGGEQIFVFGGSTNVDGDVCTNQAQVTGSGAAGLCFTSEPSNDPTMEPTNDPTMEPTMYPTVQPTGVPSASPSKAPTDMPSQSPLPEPTQTPVAYEPEAPKYKTSGASYGIIITILVIICCLILGCLWWYSREEKRADSDRMAEVLVADGGTGTDAVGDNE